MWRKVVETPEYQDLQRVTDENLAEEQAAEGNQYATLPHALGRVALMRALGREHFEETLAWFGEDIDNLERVPSAPRQVVEANREGIDYHPLFGAALFLYYEFRIGQDYPELVEGGIRLHDLQVPAPGSVTRDTDPADLLPLWHLYDHGGRKGEKGHDEDHTRAALEAIAAAVKTPEDVAIVRHALNHGQRTWNQFYDKVGELTARP